MTAVSVTLNNGQVIEFEANDATQVAGRSYSLDSAGVLTIESRQISAEEELVITYRRFSPAAWHCVEEADSPIPCVVAPWHAGVIGSRF
jgi:hypothetical protein